jgi:hypothetical protein
LKPSDGSVILTTGAMQGVTAGTPVTTENGQYILATHNVDGAQGFFSVFDISFPSAPFFSYSSTTVLNEPFGAIGYYWSPIEGNFPGGELNTNDVFIWSFNTNLNLNNGTVGTPGVFAFQLPTNPMAPPNVTLVVGDRDYQSKLPPILTDGGLSMYWSLSRSRVYAWVGDGSGRLDFTTNGIANVFYDRGVPPSSAADAPPTLSNANGTAGFIVGPTASNQIFRLDRNFSDTPGTTVPTAAVITSRLLVSPDDMFVYYASPAPDSTLYQLDSTTLATVWALPLSGGISGDIAMTINGARVIVADISGAVTAFTVATAEPETPIAAPAPTPDTGASPTGSSGAPATTRLSDLISGGPAISMTPSSTRVPTPVRSPVQAPVQSPVQSPESGIGKLIGGVIGGIAGGIVISALVAFIVLKRKGTAGGNQDTSVEPPSVVATKQTLPVPVASTPPTPPTRLTNYEVTYKDQSRPAVAAAVVAENVPFAVALMANSDSGSR